MEPLPEALQKQIQSLQAWGELFGVQFYGVADAVAFATDIQIDAPNWTRLQRLTDELMDICAEHNPAADPTVFQDAFNAIEKVHLTSPPMDLSEAGRLLTRARIVRDRIITIIRSGSAGKATLMPDMSSELSIEGNAVASIRTDLTVKQIWPWRKSEQRLDVVAKHLAPMVKRAVRTVKDWSATRGWSGNAGRPNDREVSVEKDLVLKTLREMGLIR